MSVRPVELTSVGSQPHNSREPDRAEGRAPSGAAGTTGVSALFGEDGQLWKRVSRGDSISEQWLEERPPGLYASPWGTPTLGARNQVVRDIARQLEDLEAAESWEKMASRHRAETARSPLADRVKCYETEAVDQSATPFDHPQHTRAHLNHQIVGEALREEFVATANERAASVRFGSATPNASCCAGPPRTTSTCSSTSIAIPRASSTSPAGLATSRAKIARHALPAFPSYDNRCDGSGFMADLFGLVRPTAGSFAVSPIFAAAETELTCLTTSTPRSPVRARRSRARTGLLNNQGRHESRRRQAVGFPWSVHQVSSLPPSHHR